MALPSTACFSPFLSTPSARRATHLYVIRKCFFSISIHALREEGDLMPKSPTFRCGLFLSTPSARRATSCASICEVGDGFLSTPSARRATSPRRTPSQAEANFYPRPPRGGRRDRHSKFKSITRFLSTPSARRATSAEAAANRAWQISIHALREEGDNSFQCSQSSRLDFYPRPPRGGRPYVAGYVTKKTYDFYPRPPRGGRPKLDVIRVQPYKFLSTPSARRATRASPKRRLPGSHFYPRPPRGGRPASPAFRRRMCRFLSTPSARRATYLC